MTFEGGTGTRRSDLEQMIRNVIPLGARETLVGKVRDRCWSPWAKVQGFPFGEQEYGVERLVQSTTGLVNGSDDSSRAVGIAREFL